MIKFRNGSVFVRGDSEDAVMNLLFVAGFSKLPPNGSLERFKRFGKTFERTSAFLSDGKLCLVLEEVR